MAAIDTCVQDLVAGEIKGIGQLPDAGSTDLDKAISMTCRVKYSFVHINAKIANQRLSCPGAEYSLTFNGSYLFYESSWATVANMDMHRRLVVSSHFAGCMWKVFRSDQEGLFKCMHIYREGNSDAIVNLATSYALQKGWTEIQAMATRGHIGIVPNCKTVAVVSQLFPHESIETVLLDLDNTGLAVGATLDTVHL